MKFKRIVKEFPLQHTPFFDTGIRIELDFIDAEEKNEFMSKFGYPHDMDIKVLATLYVNQEIMAWHAVYVVHDGKWDLLPPSKEFSIPNGVLSAVESYYSPAHGYSPDMAAIAGYFTEDSVRCNSWVPAIVKRHADGSCEYVLELGAVKSKKKAEDLAHAAYRLCIRRRRGTPEAMEMHLLPGFPIHRLPG